MGGVRWHRQSVFVNETEDKKGWVIGMSEMDTMDTTNSSSLKREYTLKSQNEPRLTVWTLIWAGLWTGVVLCGFVWVLR